MVVEEKKKKIILIGRWSRKRNAPNKNESFEF